MQKQTQGQSSHHNKLFASKIFKELEAEALKNIKGRKLMLIEDEDRNIEEKIMEYTNIKEWIYNKDIEDQKRLLPVLKRIKSEAIGLMIRNKRANFSQLKKLGLSAQDVLFEEELKLLMAFWIEYEYECSKVTRNGLRQIAKNGHLVDYKKLINFMKNILHVKPLRNPGLKKQWINCSIRKHIILMEKRSKFQKRLRM